MIDGILRDLGVAETAIGPTRLMLGVFCAFAGRIGEFALHLDGSEERTADATAALVGTMLADERVQALLQVNRYREDLYFSSEGFALFSEWLRVLILWELCRADDKTRGEQRPAAAELIELLNFLPQRAAQTGYKLEKFLGKLSMLSG